jgi:ABC-2 type transport system permease protein
MTTATTAAASRSGAGRALALAAVEVRTVLRNRTTAVTSIVVPTGLGLFWAVTVGAPDPEGATAVVALQLAVVLAMSVYVTATQTLVARRQARVLKRMQTTSLSDAEVLIGTLAPCLVLGIAQLAVFAVVDVAAGVPLPVDVLPLVVAVVGGLALVVTAAVATSIVTPSPERAQITTLPLVFVLLGGAFVLSVAPVGTVWQALVVVPGAAVGQLAQLAMTGTTWGPGLGGVPAVLPALAATAVWQVVLGAAARRRFRWDPRH